MGSKLDLRRAERGEQSLIRARSLKTRIPGPRVILFSGSRGHAEVPQWPGGEKRFQLVYVNAILVGIPIRNPRLIPHWEWQLNYWYQRAKVPHDGGLAHAV